MCARAPVSSLKGLDGVFALSWSCKFHYFRRPPFRHADAFVPIGRSVIGLAHMIVADMSKLGFDSVRVPFPALIEQA